MKRTDLSYSGVEYDYERSGCTCNDCPCRCTTIERTWIESIDINEVISNLCSTHFKLEELSYIDFYCFDRICRQFNIWDKRYYEIEVCGGYYGEEIDGVYFANEEKIIYEFYNILAFKNDMDKIKHVLKLEYGYVLENVKNASRISVIDCDPKFVVALQKEYYHKLEKDVINSYKDYKAPCAVCKKQRDRYLIIDGYHRVAANKDKESIAIIVIE